MSGSKKTPSPSTFQKPQTYEQAGVSRETGDQLVDWLDQSTKKSPLIVSGIGGYASITRIPFDKYKRPHLVTCTDGVGTKALLAAQSGRVRGLGQDLVAMNVNDLICTGGDPYYFLDYWASGRLNLNITKDFLAGVRDACEASGCVLVGGETAEMPGLYQGSDFDCAGFAAGFVDEDQVWGVERVRTGAEVWALSSSGFHSNGYSLLRRVFEKDMDQWIEDLLIPTALYVRPVQELKKAKVEIQATAHITGSGFENILRVMPAHTQIEIEDYPWPERFKEVQKRADLSDMEMLKTLNCGVGFVFVISSDQSEKLKSVLNHVGYLPWLLGRIEKSQSAEPSFLWKGQRS